MFDSIPQFLAYADPNPEAAPSGKDKAGTPGTPGTPAKDAAPAKDSATTGTGAPVGPGGQQRAPESPFGGSFLFILMGGLLLMIIFSMRTQRKEKKKREALMGGMKKGDRVQTIGGMIGNVIEVRPDVVIIKADENNNTKLTFVRAAIQAVLTDKDAEKPEPEVKSS